MQEAAYSDWYSKSEQPIGTAKTYQEAVEKFDTTPPPTEGKGQGGQNQAGSEQPKG